MMRTRWIPMAILGLLGLRGYEDPRSVGATPPAVPMSAAAVDVEALGAGADGSWQRAVCAAVEAKEYDASVAADGQLQTRCRGSAGGELDTGAPGPVPGMRMVFGLLLRDRSLSSVNGATRTSESGQLFAARHEHCSRQIAGHVERRSTHVE